MLTCIARSKQPDDQTDESNRVNGGSTTPANKQAIKTLTSQVTTSNSISVRTCLNFVKQFIYDALIDYRF